MDYIKNKKGNFIINIIAATKYSLYGLKRLWEEKAFRYEITSYIAVLFLFYLIGASYMHFIIITMLSFIVFAMESLNTAIEETINHISPQWSKTAKNAKDLGSFAVFCALMVNVVYILYVLTSTL
jgi:diacylglycerol kinase (ATP)